MRTIQRGPGDLRPSDTLTRRTSDGKEMVTEWNYPYYVDRSENQYGATRREIREWIKWVVQHSKSWVRAGVWMEDVGQDRARAIVVVRYVKGPFTCGSVRDAAGCAQRNYFPNGQHLIRLSHLVFPRTPQERQHRPKGVEHEIAHLAFEADHPLDKSDWGIMGGTLPGDPRWPVDDDIESAVRYANGGAG